MSRMKTPFGMSTGGLDATVFLTMAVLPALSPPVALLSPGPRLTARALVLVTILAVLPLPRLVLGTEFQVLARLDPMRLRSLVLGQSGALLLDIADMSLRAGARRGVAVVGNLVGGGRG